MIGIINMQTNNINCFVKILKRLKYQYKVINSYEDYNNDIIKLIIPGIGNYKSSSDYIKKTGIDKIIKEHNMLNKKIMGICIGMQILTTYGDESGYSEGLNIFENTKTEKLKTNTILPHIGWNSIKLLKPDYDNLFNDINLRSDFYFVHSYNVVCENNNLIMATTYYEDIEFISIIKTENILAVQFHPEKSGVNGIKLIENFLKW